MIKQAWMVKIKIDCVFFFEKCDIIETISLDFSKNFKIKRLCTNLYYCSGFYFKKNWNKRIWCDNFIVIIQHFIYHKKLRTSWLLQEKIVTEHRSNSPDLSPCNLRLFLYTKQSFSISEAFIKSTQRIFRTNTNFS